MSKKKQYGNRGRKKISVANKGETIGRFTEKGVKLSGMTGIRKIKFAKTGGGPLSIKCVIKLKDIGGKFLGFSKTNKSNKTGGRPLGKKL